MIEAASPKVLLVSMPWRETHMPNAGLGLLKAVLLEAGCEAVVYDANLVVRDAIGELYGDLAQHTFAEVAFAHLVYEGYSEQRASDALTKRFERILGGRKRDAIGDDRDVDEKLAMAAALPGKMTELLARIAGQISWQDFDVVGFSCTFNQTLASAALARAVRERAPGVLLIAGGAACDGVMGKAFMETFPWFDAVAVGRAEGSIADLCAELLRPAPRALPGTIVRSGSGLEENERRPPRASLDALPLPNYDEFFALSKELGIRSQQPSVPIEASLGCWWGEKNLCTFCGLNATSLSFAQKSPERVLREIRELSSRYHVDRIEFTDNILPLDYYETLVPELIEGAARGEHYEFFVEIKTNVKRAQLERLREAGFRYFQPGIESFADGILRLMKKGNTALSQIQFIRWCDELRLRTAYNVIVGSPGESAEDYRQMAELIPGLAHLTPPSSDPKMQLQRFSPYFDHAERHGIRNVRPSEMFSDIFPDVPEERLSRLVYFFDYEHDELDAPELSKARRLAQAMIARWQAVHRPGLCTYRRGNGWVRIDDQREGAWHGTGKRKWTTLRGDSARVFLAADRGRSIAQLASELSLGAAAVTESLRRLVADRLVYFDGRKALSLPTCVDQSSPFAIGLEPLIAPSEPPSELRWQPGRALSRRRRRSLPLAV